jgi:hypothetical protein
VNLLEAVLSRQRTEAAKITLPLNGLLGAAGAVQSRAVRAAGYNSVVGLVVSDVPGTVTIMAAPETRRGGRRAPGTFVPIAVIPTAALGGVQAAQIDEEVRGDYIRVDYANGASPQTVFQFSVYLVPVFCFKRVELAGGEGAATPNRASFNTNQQNVAAPGTAVQLQDQAIPDGFAVVVKSKKANTGAIRVGFSAADAQNAAKAFVLADAKDFVRLFITNTSLIWIDAAIAGEGVEWIVET